MTEDQLCCAFSERVRSSPEFAAWVLSRTRFGKYRSCARLLHEEQKSIRPRKFWWRHWWCHVPELKKDRETDIFMVFEIDKSKKRFAIHIENKKNSGSFAIGQADAYRIRAQHMANKREYLNYEDYTTVLISPLAFRIKRQTACDRFDCHISYEDIANFVPEFKSP